MPAPRGCPNEAFCTFNSFETIFVLLCGREVERGPSCRCVVSCSFKLLFVGDKDPKPNLFKVTKQLDDTSLRSYRKLSFLHMTAPVLLSPYPPLTTLSLAYLILFTFLCSVPFWVFFCCAFYGKYMKLVFCTVRFCA